MSFASASLDVEQVLLALSETHKYLAGSLRLADTFRVVADRLKRVVSFNGIALLVFDGARERLRVGAWQGNLNPESYLDDPVVLLCIENGCIHTSTGRPTTIALPLFANGNAIAVLLFELPAEMDARDVSLSTLGSIADRVAPLILRSLSFERSEDAALIDSVTQLPNERAFLHALETQIAESQRSSCLRPLSIIAIDLKNFDDIIQRFGHAAGDRVLASVARSLRADLREMDLVARSSADEFLIVTPTASADISDQIITRLDASLSSREVAASDLDAVEVSLNFGAASLGPDGDDPEALLKVARIRKDQSKSVTPNNVLWFPREFAN